jgi:hypothetical protein
MALVTTDVLETHGQISTIAGKCQQLLPGPTATAPALDPTEYAFYGMKLAHVQVRHGSDVGRPKTLFLSQIPCPIFGSGLIV